VKYMSLFHCHTLPPLLHTRTSPPFTHARIQSVSKYRSKGKLRVREKGREAGEEEMACSARRETCLRSRSTPRIFDDFPCFVHACRLLSTQNVAQQCRTTAEAHPLRSSEQLASEHASCSHSQGLRKGVDAAPCSRRSQAWGGVSSRSLYLHTTRPSGRVSCGSSAKRISGGQARKYGKEAKPVGGRATTITV
jgi:hypothetical protein